MITGIDESVRVAAVFANGAVRPVWFDWRGRQVRIREVVLTWKTREGSALLLHFSVTDGANLYEICYNAERFAWRLLKAEA